MTPLGRGRHCDPTTGGGGGMKEFDKEGVGVGSVRRGGGWRVGAGGGMKEYDREGVGSVRR